MSGYAPQLTGPSQPRLSKGLNLIEEIFTKLEGVLRKIQARTLEVLWRGYGIFVGISVA